MVKFLFKWHGTSLRWQVATEEILNAQSFVPIPSQILGTRHELSGFLSTAKFQDVKFSAPCPQGTRIYAVLKNNPDIQTNFARGSTRMGVNLVSIFKGIRAIYRYFNPNLTICLFDSEPEARNEPFAKNNATFVGRYVTVSELQRAFATDL